MTNENECTDRDKGGTSWIRQLAAKLSPTLNVAIAVAAVAAVIVAIIPLLPEKDPPIRKLEYLHDLPAAEAQWIISGEVGVNATSRAHKEVIFQDGAKLMLSADSEVFRLDALKVVVGSEVRVLGKGSTPHPPPRPGTPATRWTGRSRTPCSC